MSRPKPVAHALAPAPDWIVATRTRASEPAKAAAYCVKCGRIFGRTAREGSGPGAEECGGRKSSGRRRQA